MYDWDVESKYFTGNYQIFSILWTQRNLLINVFIIRIRKM